MTSRVAPVHRRVLAAAAALALGGCASTAIEQNFGDARQLAQDRLGTELKWLRTDEARREAATDVDAALARPLSADNAVRLALSTSPAVQALLYESAGSGGSFRYAAHCLHTLEKLGDYLPVSLRLFGKLNDAPKMIFPASPLLANDPLVVAALKDWHEKNLTGSATGVPSLTPDA